MLVAASDDDTHLQSASAGHKAARSKTQQNSAFPRKFYLEPVANFLHPTALLLRSRESLRFVTAAVASCRSDDTALMNEQSTPLVNTTSCDAALETFMVSLRQ
jgi:hypothetical protein